MKISTNSIALDPQTDSTIKALMDSLNESSREGVIRKAVALMKQAVDMSKEDRYFILENSKGEKTRIWLD